jgi:hypothetical protein
MLKGSTTVIPYSEIDYGILGLVRYMNEIDGIETTESCCGHGEAPCRIWFRADNTECLTRFWYKYFYGNPNWNIVLDMDDSDIDDGLWDKPKYLLETSFQDHYYTGLAIDNLTYKFKYGRVR